MSIVLIDLKQLRRFMFLVYIKRYIVSDQLFSTWIDLTNLGS